MRKINKMIKKLILLAVSATPFFYSAQEVITSQEPKIAITPSVGYAWRLAKLPAGINNDTRNYIKGLKNGVDVGVGAYYLLRGNGAIGLKYSGYFASSEGRITVQDAGGQYVTGYVSTKDNMSFVGVSYMLSNFKDDTRHKLFYDVALGVITYTTKTGNVKGTGSSFGADINIGYQYAVNEHFFIGPKIGFTGGTLSKMKYNGTTVNFGEDQKEGLTRLSLSAAATFRF